MSKRLSKYMAYFDHFDKSIIALSVTIANISIASFAKVIGAPVRMVTTSFSLASSIFTGIVKKTVKNNKK